MDKLTIKCCNTLFLELDAVQHAITTILNKYINYPGLCLYSINLATLKTKQSQLLSCINRLITPDFVPSKPELRLRKPKSKLGQPVVPLISKQRRDHSRIYKVNKQQRVRTKELTAESINFSNDGLLNEDLGFEYTSY